MNDLVDGLQQISLLLKQFIEGSLDIFGEKSPLIIKLQSLRNVLKNDNNSENYQILLQTKFEIILLYTMEMSIRRRNLEILESILGLLVTICNNSVEVITALMKTNFPKLLIDCIVALYESKMVFASLEFVNLYFMIIFNIVRHRNFRQYFQRHAEIARFKNGIIQFFHIKKEDIQIISYMIFGFLAVNDNDKNIIVKYFDIVGNIFGCLSDAYKSESGKCRYFDILELLLGLEALCNIDEIKEKIINMNDFISTIINIATSDSSKSENVFVALEILENLCTEENVQKILLNQYHLDRVIDPLTNSKVDSIKTNAKRLLTHLSTLCHSNDNRCEYDVVISYCDHDREVIYKITEKLTETNNIKLARLLPGSLDFKTVINRSKVLIVGVSISFQEDVRCLSQVLYAHQSGKRIIPLLLVHKLKLSNLLESVIGSNECVDFSDCTMFIDSMADFVQLLLKNNQSEQLKKLSVLESENEIKDVQSKEVPHLNVSDMIKKFDKMECKSNLHVTKSMTAPKPYVSTLSSNFKEFPRSKSLNESNVFIQKSANEEAISGCKVNFEQWSKYQISEWLTENDLSEIHNKFNNFDGAMLKAMMNMKNKTAKTYYQQLQSIGLDFSEILKFDVAIDRIG